MKSNDPAKSRSTIAATCSGLLLTAAFPKFGWSPLAWIALTPLLWSLRYQTPRQGFRLGLWCGIAHFATLLYWLVGTMQLYGGLPLILAIPILLLLVSYLALYTAVFAACLTVLSTRPWHLLVAGPMLWVGLEWVRGVLLTGFPWALLGYSQYAVLPLVQIADFSGVYGVSFIIVFANVALFLVLLAVTANPWQHRGVTGRLSLGAAATALLIVGLCWGYGQMRLRALPATMDRVPNVRIAVIQGNIDQAQKWDPAFQAQTLRKYLDLSLATRNARPDLIVWPETATPFYFGLAPKMTTLLLNGIRETGIDFLFGSPSVTHQNETAAYYNSAYLVDKSGTTIGKYNKVHLVPYGEYVPLKKFFPFIGKMVAQVGDFRSGPPGQILAWRKFGIGVQICYEIIFPALARDQVQNDAGVLINITNDAWFGRSSAPYQHFSMSVFRAIENRRSLVRAANTGISGYIDPAGRRYLTSRLFEDFTAAQNVPVLRQSTFYTRHGDLLPMAGVILTALALLGKRLRTALQGKRR